jgi:hypothetical protein
MTPSTGNGPRAWSDRHRSQHQQSHDPDGSEVQGSEARIEQTCAHSLSICFLSPHHRRYAITATPSRVLTPYFNHLLDNAPVPHQPSRVRRRRFFHLFEKDGSVNSGKIIGMPGRNVKAQEAPGSRAFHENMVACSLNQVWSIGNISPIGAEAAANQLRNILAALELDSN